MRSKSQVKQRTKNISRALAFLMILVLGLATWSTSSMADHDAESGPREFTVRITNLSRGNTLETSEGAFLSVPLSPGVWAVHADDISLFTEGASAGSEGLEALAEDGNPSDLGRAIDRGTGFESTGIFNMPFGTDSPAPIGSGQAYLFTFIAEPGEHLSFATMFVQSNDLFFAPDAEGIELFDEEGLALNGDITQLILLWDAGTEVNQEPGVGADQAPRQSGPNIGADENGSVRLVNDPYDYPDVNKVINVVITSRPLDDEEEI